MKKILIIYPGALGDVLLTRPAIYCLKRRFPGCQIDFVGNPDYLQLLRPEIHRIFNYHTRDLVSLYSPASTLDPDCKAWLNLYDVLIFWSDLQDETMVAKLHQLRHPKVISHRTSQGPDLQIHQSLFFIRSLEPLGIGPSPEALSILPEVSCTRVSESNRNRILIHPGSGSRRKNLPPAMYRHLLSRLYRLGLEGVVLLGPAEKEIVDEFKGGDWDLKQPRNCLELVGWLTQGGSYIGNDSGVSHLAGQMNLPTLTIFRTTNPLVWAPLGRQVLVVHEQPLACSLPNFFYLNPITPGALGELFIRWTAKLKELD